MSGYVKGQLCLAGLEPSAGARNRNSPPPIFSIFLCPDFTLKCTFDNFLLFWHIILSYLTGKPVGTNTIVECHLDFIQKDSCCAFKYFNYRPLNSSSPFSTTITNGNFFYLFLAPEGKGYLTP